LSNDADSTRTQQRTLAAEVKLYYDLDVPVERNGACPLLIALHGYGDNKAWMLREARKLAPGGFAVAALQGFHQHMKKAKRDGAPFGYGFGWLTNFRAEESVALHHRALLDLIEPLVREGIAIREQIYLLGFSQSVALNYRFVFAYPNIVRGVVGICGGLPGDWETSEVYVASGTSVLHLCGTRDEFYPPARVEDYLRRLSTRAADVELKSYDAAHEIAPAMRDDVRVWLQSRASI